MYLLLTQYLLDNGRLPLPGMGELSVENESARYDSAERILHPPFQKVFFTPCHAIAEQPLLRFLSFKTNTQEDTIFEQYHQFCNQLLETIHQKGICEWQGLGKWMLLNTKDITFLPFANNPQFTPIEPTVALHSDRPHQVLVGDEEKWNLELEEPQTEIAEKSKQSNWWIPTVIVASIVILLIIARSVHLL